MQYDEANTIDRTLYQLGLHLLHCPWGEIQCKRSVAYTMSDIEAGRHWFQGLSRRWHDLWEKSDIELELVIFLKWNINQKAFNFPMTVVKLYIFVLEYCIE